jgi:serine/threonine protein kinase
MSSIRVADRYVLDREVGRGGSGAVWLGRDELLGRQVALKRIGLPPGASASEHARAEREARMAARVNHPNVIAVFDYVDDGQQQWLVTEYVDGTTLARMVRDRGPLSPDEAAPVLLQAAEALAAAHRGGVVHRDVKPSNILIAVDGTVKLSDFGIARGIADASLTQTGLVTGSPAYLAPEVATGASATTASDVWSFGTTIFHALAGRPPYETEGDGNVLAVLYRVAHEPPPRLDDAGWLTPLLSATMDQDPARRPTMDDVVDFLKGRPHPAPVVETQVLAATTPPPPPAAPPPPLSTMTQPMTPAPARPPRSAGSARSGALRAGIAGAAVLLVLAVIGIALLVGNKNDPSATDNGSGTTPASQDGKSGSTTSGAPLPSESELEDFATTYVETASTVPAAGFAMLTPDYQARSPEYTTFWGSVKHPKIKDLSADPADLTVTYTYEYEQEHEGKREETVTLHLVQDGDRLLIDDAVSSG